MKQNEKTVPVFKGSEFIKRATGTTKDILTVLLDPNEAYTEDEVGAKVDAYLSKEVKD